ncbi:MAG: hypothetical protein EBT57_08045 [Verrucomicrobia bacterium]|nr:hypothetical protein [Verrucomicrobiota bacterium]
MRRWPELFLALQFLRPRRSFVSIITILSWLGVVAGVLVLIVVQSVMSGFEDELTRKVIGFQSHLTVAGNTPLRDPVALLEQIRQEPEVVGATPSVLGPVLAETRSRISTPRIKGWEAESAPAVIPLPECVIEGTWAPGGGVGMGQGEPSGTGYRGESFGPPTVQGDVGGKNAGSSPAQENPASENVPGGRHLHHRNVRL